MVEAAVSSSLGAQLWVRGSHCQRGGCRQDTARGLRLGPDGGSAGEAESAAPLKASRRTEAGLSATRGEGGGALRVLGGKPPARQGGSRWAVQGETACCTGPAPGVSLPREAFFGGRVVGEGCSSHPPSPLLGSFLSHNLQPGNWFPLPLSFLQFLAW